MNARFLFVSRFVLILTLCAACSRGFAQISFTGTVFDPDGAAVPDVQVTLKSLNASKASVYAAVSDSGGRFLFSHLSPGPYSLQIPAVDGFEEYMAPIQIGPKMRSVRITLSTPKVSETVTVTEDNAQINLDSADNHDQVTASSQMLERVPVFDQDYIGALTPFLDQTGIASGGVSIIVDGVEMKGTGVSASAIAEARINNDPYSAETMRPGRGRIEIITKPGAPQLHGTLNFTFRDSAFDAQNYFAESKPFEQKRIYEGSITGPIPLDHKTTFLVSTSRQEDNLQSIVHANTPSGLLSQNVSTPVHNTEAAVRASHDFSNTHRASVQYNVVDTISRNLGVGGLVLPEAGVNSQAREDDILFNDRWIVSPSLLNQFQLLGEKDHNPTRSSVNAEKIAVDGAFTGGGAQIDLLNTENNAKINDIVSWTDKHHYIKFGVNINNLSRRAWDDHSNRIGSYNFASLNDYENHIAYSFTQQEGQGRAIFWMNELGAFIQDQIQLRPNLQLSIGLRYDWQTYFRSANDLAPRFSLAYSTPNHKTIMRAGAGLFYDRSGAAPIADLKRYNGRVLRSILFLNPAYPTPYPPSTDIAALPTNLVIVGDETRIPYVSNYSISMERELSKTVTIAATYRGTLGMHLFLSRDVNAPLPPYYALPRPATRYGSIRQIESESRQLGNALDLTMQGKSSRWFSGMAQYTLSRTNNNTGGITWFPQDQYSMNGEYSRSDFDQRHRFNLLATFNEESWFNLGAAIKLYSGLPYTETSGVDSFNTGILNARPSGVGRNTLQTGGTKELDLRWSHNLNTPRKGDRTPAFSLAVDAFNITNTANFTSYIGNLQSAFFEQPTSAAPARRLQLTARIKF